MSVKPYTRKFEAIVPESYSTKTEVRAELWQKIKSTLENSPTSASVTGALKNVLPFFRSEDSKRMINLGDLFVITGIPASIKDKTCDLTFAQLAQAIEYCNMSNEAGRMRDSLLVPASTPESAEEITIDYGEEYQKFLASLEKEQAKEQALTGEQA